MPLGEHPVWNGGFRGEGREPLDHLRGQLDHGANVGVPTGVTGAEDVAIDVSLGWDGSYVVNGDPFSGNHPDLTFVICGLLGKASSDEDVFHSGLCGGAEHVVHV
jgi:hypothetical protein